jgi:hypothetical protein
MGLLLLVNSVNIYNTSSLFFRDYMPLFVKFNRTYESR